MGEARGIPAHMFKHISSSFLTSFTIISRASSQLLYPEYYWMCPFTTTGRFAVNDKKEGVLLCDAALPPCHAPPFPAHWHFVPFLPSFWKSISVGWALVKCGNFFFHSTIWGDKDIHEHIFNDITINSPSFLVLAGYNWDSSQSRMSMPAPRRAEKSKKAKIKSLLASTEQAEDDMMMEEWYALLSL